MTPKLFPMLVTAIFLSLFASPSPAKAAAGDNPDYEMESNSLTNKVRSYDLRVKSMETLVSNYPDKVFPILVNLLKDPQEKPAFRYLAAERLQRVNPARAGKVFRDFLENRTEDPFARRTAISQLVSLKEGYIKQKIRDILDDPREDPAIRQYALAIYSDWNEKGKIEKLRGFVRSPRETLSLRTNALFLLESLGDSEFVLESIRRILNDKTEPEELRRNSIIMAQRMNNPEILTLLKKMAQDGRESARLREFAKASLASSKSQAESS